MRFLHNGMTRCISTDSWLLCWLLHWWSYRMRQMFLYKVWLCSTHWLTEPSSLALQVHCLLRWATYGICSYVTKGVSKSIPSSPTDCTLQRTRMCSSYEQHWRALESCLSATILFRYLTSHIIRLTLRHLDKICAGNFSNSVRVILFQLASP